MEVKIRPATREDFMAFHGETWPRTCRAWAAEADGQLVALAGYALEPGYTYAFSVMKENHGLPTRLILREARRLFAEMQKHRLPLVARANPELPRAGKFLRSLGFRLLQPSLEGDIYQWN